MTITKGLLAGVTLALLGTTASAENLLRWGGSRDIFSLDPYSYGDTYTIAFLNHVYEGLVRFDADLKIEPALATEWEQVNPTTWRFKLREGVKFHDGADFNADDVLASLKRVSDPASPLRGNIPAYKSSTKIDDYTIEIEMHGSYPLMLNDLTNIFIFDEGWLKANNSEKPTDLGGKVEGYATFNTNGTGPFVLESRVPDSQTILVRNANWWQEPIHNIDRIEFAPIKSAPTRAAALLSGELDFTDDAPVQDLPRLEAAGGINVLEKPNLRTVFFGFNRKDKLADGRDNPFKDLRVRQAFELAIDRDVLHAKVMRGKSRITGTLVAPEILGYDEALDTYPKADPAKARELLIEAGQENAPITLTCTSDTFVNEEAICNAAVSMLTRAGFKPVLDIAPAAVQAPKRTGGLADVYTIGWANEPMLDSYSILSQMISTKEKASGIFNWGGWSYPQIDELTQQAAVELDVEKRRALEVEALRIAKEEVILLPLHQQPMAWVTSDKVESVLQLPDNKARHWLTVLK